MVRENAWYDLNFLEFVEACFVSCVVYLWDCSMYIWKECVFFFFGMKDYIYIYISVKFIWSKTLFNAAISLLIFYLEDLSIFDSGVLKSLTMIVLLSIFFFKSSRIFWCISVASVVISPLSFLIVFIWVLSLFSWWICLMACQYCFSFQRSSSWIYWSFELFF